MNSIEQCEAYTIKGSLCTRSKVKGQSCCRIHLKISQECSICYELGLNYQLKCGHWFHRKCFEKWKQISRKSNSDVTCPICRRVESKRRIIQNSNQESETDNDTQHLVELLSVLFPFPAQMVEMIAEDLLLQLSD